MTPPLFSVIVPVHRHWDLVPALLEALADQRTDPARFEILIVNNDAPKPAPPLELPGNARMITCATPGSYAARNAGAAAAHGDWLAFTDADCRPPPRWLEALADATAGGGLLAGPVEIETPVPDTPFAVYDRVRGIPQPRYIARGYAATANLAVPKPVFRALGGFAPERFSGGDAEFCRRAGRAGHGLRLVETARTVHLARVDWAALADKTRRIKGGQIAAGPLPRRIAWSLRTLAPPLRDTLAFLHAPFPVSKRATAIAVRFRIWGVELAETVRLLAGGAPERR